MFQANTTNITVNKPKAVARPTPNSMFRSGRKHFGVRMREELLTPGATALWDFRREDRRPCDGARHLRDVRRASSGKKQAHAFGHLVLVCIF